jgi:hypothetical protein
MSMENVTCNIDIETTDGEHIFDDGWDFTIDIYRFQKISNTRVRITFTYADEVTRVADDGVTEMGHTTWSDKYVQVEEDLQTLLDVICFQTSGIGLRIIPHSLEMKSSQMTSNRMEQQHSITLKDHDDIEARYKATVDGKKEALMDALRLNRLAANEENDGEKIGQLWGAVERLYGTDPPKVLDTKAKRQEIQKLIDQATLISSKDKERLKNTINNTFQESKPSVVAQKFGLIGGDGQKMTDAEVKQKLDYWLGARSLQSHGKVLARNRDVHMLANEMEHIMEMALSGEVKPSKYIYILYKTDDFKDDFLSSHQASTKQDTKSGYSYTPLHKFAAFADMSDRLRYSLKSDNAELFLVD